VPVLQEDKQMEEQADKTEAETNSININTIILLNGAVGRGEISRDVAINILSGVMECDVEDAKKYIN
jgi:hypothetical protein